MNIKFIDETYKYIKNIESINLYQASSFYLSVDSYLQENYLLL